MKLQEFDKIRQFLPSDTEVQIMSGPSDISEPAMGIEEWGNHDGRFNLRCKCCGYHSDDIPRNQKSVMQAAVKTMTCPGCGATKYTPKTE